jgi:tRNA-uridine 2-sulfurtransferase
MEKKIKAIGLLSGGLDSIVAARLILEQGIEVEALNFVTVFCTCTSKGSTCMASQKAAEQLNVPLKVIDISEEYLDIIKKPKYGYGSGINPCLDCRIFTLKKAKEYMEEAGASFIFTGEVLGQRPMSQRRQAMNIIERDSGLQGYLVRPLSAKFFPPTLPEEKGILDRNMFLAISGRSRKPQILMAEKFNIKDYPCSAGGCLLTVKDFANRMRDLMEHDPDFKLADVNLLKYGRHFRVSARVKLVVGRNELENNKIAALKRQDDVLFHAQEPLGPVSLLRGASEGEFISEAAAITASYALGRGNDGEVKIRYFGYYGGGDKYLKTGPFEDAELNRRMV